MPRLTPYLWPALLSISRLLLAAPSFWFIVTERWLEALLVWILAVILDFADGPLARKLQAESIPGRLLDHGADAVFVTVTLTALALGGQVTLWLPAAIALAFILYFSDHYWHRDAKNGLRIPHWFGKLNGVSYYVLAVIPLAQMVLGISLIGQLALLLLSWVSFALTGILIIAGRLRLYL